MTVGPAGGSVRSADGVLTLVLPPGAVPAPLAVTITPLGAGGPASPEGERAVTAVYAIEARAATGAVVAALNRPATVLVRVADAGAHIARHDGSEWVLLPTTRSDGDVSASLPALGAVAAFVATPATAPDESVGAAWQTPPLLAAAAAAAGLLALAVRARSARVSR